MRQSNILLVWNRIGDYHRARIEALQKKVPDVQVYSADMVRTDQLYHWGNSTENSSYIPLSGHGLKGFLDFVRIVHEKSIKCVGVPGYAKFIYLAMMIYCKFVGAKVMLFAESWYPGAKLIDACKGIFLNIFASGLFVSGQRAAQHFENRLKVDPNKINIGYSIVDNTHFNISDLNVSRYASKQLLCVARFSEEKNLNFLIDTFLESKMIEMGWTVRIVGAGPLEENLRQKYKESRHIEIQNWVAYEDLPKIYAEASTFALPSIFEPWGLVVNEAMAAGLPVLVSSACGCYPDLKGEHMLNFEPTSQHDLLQVLNSPLFNDPARLYELGRKSQEVITQWTPWFWATQFMNTIN